jgi:hypothetical protein
MSLRGGVFFFDPYETRNTSIFVIQNHFVSNRAMQGGAIFFSQLPSSLKIVNCSFHSNEAYLYGDTFASVADTLLWTKIIAVDVVLSGATLPPFAVAMLDVFGQDIVPINFRLDFVFIEVQIQCSGDHVQTCQATIATEIAKPLLSTESPFTKTEVLGYPGRYTLVISPVINYDKSRFRVEKNLTISECQTPDILFTFPHESLPRCVLRKNTLDPSLRFSFHVLLQRNVFRDAWDNMENV